MSGGSIHRADVRALARQRAHVMIRDAELLLRGAGDRVRHMLSLARVDQVLRLEEAT
jgi:hypothetical protein